MTALLLLIGFVVTGYVIVVGIAAIVAHGPWNRRAVAIRRLQRDRHYNTPEFLYNPDYDRIGQAEKGSDL